MRRILTVCALALVAASLTLYHFAPSSAATTIKVPADYPTIQSAINAAADGDTVLVAPGTYLENLDFGGKAIDVVGAGAASTIIDGQSLDSVVKMGTQNGFADIEGFTLQNGLAESGGGVFVRAGAARIAKNVIRANSACFLGGAIGTSLEAFQLVVIEDNLITDNRLEACPGQVGGTIFVQASRLSRNTITGNEGAVGIAGGTGVVIENNFISTNGPQGLSLGSTEALVVQNRIQSSGDGIVLGNVADVDLVNNSVQSSSFAFADAGILNRTFLANNIFVTTGSEAVVFCFDAEVFPDERVIHANNFYRATTGPIFENCPDVIGQDLNISEDPVFVSAVDFHLQPTSPSIDAGNNSVDDVPQADLEGLVRIADGNGDTGAVVDQGAYEFGSTIAPTPTQTPTLPDLRITSVAVELESGNSCGSPADAFGVRVTVKNQGDALTGSFVVNVNGGEQTVAGGLAAGQMAQLWFGVLAPDDIQDVAVDSTFLVAEFNEFNNTLSQFVPVPAQPPTCTSTATTTPSATATPTRTPTSSATSSAIVGPGIAKIPEGNANNTDLSIPAANLWICEAPAACAGPGEGALRVVERASNVVEGLGAYEFTVEYDNFVIQSVNPCDLVFGPGGAGSARGPVDELNTSAINPDCAPDPNNLTNGTCAMSLVLENLVHFGCVSSGQAAGPTGSVDLASLLLIPHPDLNNDLFPGNNNGVPTVLKDNGCELVDTLGHPVSGSINGGLTPYCRDLAVTVRILEGDLDLDCDVDLTDAQAIASRYGAFFGGLLYSKWYDLEPQFHDLDIDIKDVQKVFGRQDSTCQIPIPAQPPLGPPTTFGD